MIARIKESDYLVIMVSENSLGSNVVSVEWKIKYADKIAKGEDTIFPLIIDDTPHENIPEYLQNIYTYRYNNDKNIAMKLIDDIQFSKAEQHTSSGHSQARAC